MIPDLIDLNEIWCFMEQAYKEGKVRAIGLSNFNEEQLLSVYDRAEIKPHCLEVSLF
jgi:diketogulonate reductase-like aldo/keto reductase